MYTRWRLYILAVFLVAIAATLLCIRFLRKRGIAISHVQAALAVAGVVLILETLIISRLSNFNLGVILPAFFGVPLLLLAVLLPQMDHGILCVLKWIILGCYGVAVCIFLVCGTLMITAEKSPEEVDADAVIVLGAAVHGDKVTWVLENRLNTAQTFLEEHPDAICIVSGGQGAGESVTEASAMKKYLVARGVDEGRIFEEGQATNTVENFDYSADIVEEQLGQHARMAFVTTDFHVFRAGRVAAKQGLAVDGIAAPDVWYLTLNNFLRECVGICVYALSGQI